MLACFIDRFLNTDEITKTAKNNLVIKNFFLGTYPSNIEPLNIKKQCCWVWNTDEDGQPGQHWVGFFKNNNTLYYFDSYGKPVEFYNREYWKNFAKQKGLTFVTYSTTQIQSNISTTCGAWVLLFLYQMCYNIQYKKSRKTNFLSYEQTHSTHMLISNEAKLQKITFRLFTNFRRLYRKACKRRCKSKNQICCNYLSLIKNK